MKKIVLFDTSYGSFNIGDYFINECFNKEMKKLLNNNFCYRVGTHNPICHFYQINRKNDYFKFYEDANYKFIIGTNIIKKNMLTRKPDWNTNIFNCFPYKDSILVGAGLSNDSNNINFYTKVLYKKILNKKYIHSVRDEKTKKFLEDLGFKAINTGCPSLWSVNKKMCSKIPKEKSENVVFTLTDYAKNKENDQKLINILNNNYKKIYIWIQGSNDYNYFKSFDNIQNIKIINPTLSEYHKFLDNNDVDYVGTRLHAGICALKHLKRTIILSVDNRARDMKETYNLNVLERNEINKLEPIINSKFKTNIKIDTKKINQWKKQFI